MYRPLRGIFLVLLVLNLTLSLSSCTSKKVKKTETRVTELHPSDSSDIVATNEVDAGAARVTTTTTVEEEKEEERSGVLGTIVGAVGDVLAFPFRLIAGLIDAIF